MKGRWPPALLPADESNEILEASGCAFISADGTRGLPIGYTSGTLNAAGTDVPLDLRGDARTLKLHLFLDKSVMELFIQGGLESITRVTYPMEEDLAVFIFAEDRGATLILLEVWAMICQSVHATWKYSCDVAKQLHHVLLRQESFLRSQR